MNKEAGYQRFRTTSQNFYDYDVNVLDVGATNPGIVVRKRIESRLSPQSAPQSAPRFSASSSSQTAPAPLSQTQSSKAKEIHKMQLK